MKKKAFPEFGNRKGMKKSIPEVREPEGNEKIPSHNSGMGIRGFHSWEWTGTGIPAYPCRGGPVRKNTLYLYIGRSNNHLVYVSHQECVAQVRSSLSDCLVGFVQHVRLQHLLQKNIFNTTENLNGGRIKPNEGHVQQACLQYL